MHLQDLCSNWKFRQVDTDEWLTATVPGGVHTDLLDQGFLKDPFISDNELKTMWVSEKDWEYKLIFQPEEKLLEEEKLFLVADGLDTVAEVFLNDHRLGKTNNQFRQWRWEVKDQIKNGENTLRIVFSGPAAYVAEAQKKRRLKGVSQAIEGGPHLRKAPCQFGWDWGPMLPAIGIWKNIRLEGHSRAKFDDIHIRQFHQQAMVAIQADINVENWSGDDLSTIVVVTDPEGQETREVKQVLDNTCSVKIRIEDPKRWWPNGYGDQNLYDIKVELVDDNGVIDEDHFRIGLRTIDLVQNEDPYGKSFQFVVNGVPIFAKGSNWIPADTFITRFSDQRLEKLIADAAKSHQNMLRVWGGGFYEEERFYDFCDKYGILIWQDFIFSCSIYPLDQKEFLENVHIEVEENIKRIRHRASLALWCGNNEMEWGWESWGWQKFPMEEQLPSLAEQFPQLKFLLDLIDDRDLLPDWEELKNAYDHFFHGELPTIISKLDPDTAYWPSSPSSDIPFHDPNGQTRGDAHFWDVWHGRKPFTAYRDSFPRFMSEFGFQAFPTMETIEFYTRPEDRNLTSYIMEHHQRGNHGNGLIIAQMTDTFQMPESFYSWIYLSNILQAEGIRYGVEHWRRNMHRVSGTLYWQLNDCWPVASWSSIDYFGRWKALHYAAKRFYSPLLLSIEDKPPRMDVHVTSDLTESSNIEVKWSLETLDGEKIDSGKISKTINPLSNTKIGEWNFGDTINEENKRETIFVCELWQDNQILSTSIGTFVPSKHLRLNNPELALTVQEDGSEFIFQCKPRRLARFVELKVEGFDVVFSDNYFDIPAGRSKTVRIPKPRNVSLDEVASRLKTYTLFDSF